MSLLLFELIVMGGEETKVLSRHEDNIGDVGLHTSTASSLIDPSKSLPDVLYPSNLAAKPKHSRRVEARNGGLTLLLSSPKHWRV